MTIDEIKSVSIVQFLGTEGFQYAYIHRGNYWYLSPFRAESSPSFNVSPTKNLWNDFGANSGGNIINLVQKMHPSWNNHQVLTYLEQQIKSHNLKYAEDYEAMTKEQQRINRWNQSQIAEKMKESKSITFIDRICKLSHPNLKSYISQRRVDFEVAQDFCKEIHYHINDKHYYAIAFENIDGGMEIRNKYCKRSIGKKTISIIRTNGESHPECCIFEGLFDMLTYASLKKWMMDIQLYIECECDYIVLNSISNIKTALPYLQNYNVIHCYLDNDAANTLVNWLGNGDDSAGMAKVNGFCQEHGFTSTQMNRLLLAGKENGDNYTSVKDCGTFLKQIYQTVNGTLPASTLPNADAMYYHLKMQQRKNKIPAQLPEGVGTANKTGELDTVENDAAIIYDTAKGIDLVVCFMSQDLTDTGAAQSTIAADARAIYGYYNE
mgnify:CR=1 FL=1